jgi:NitT/TauT family transport system substrate-binding protein
MQYGTNVRTEYVAMMKRARVDLNAVIEVPSRYDIQPFLSGSVDVWSGYTINEPLVAESHGVPVNIIKPSDYGVEMYADCIITSEKMIRERPELVRRFVGAVIRGWYFALANREEAVATVLRQDPHLLEEHERRMLEECGRLILTPQATEHGIGWMDEMVWQKMLDELKSQDLLGPHPVVISEVYTNEFIPTGAPKAGRVGGSDVH